MTPQECNRVTRLKTAFNNLLNNCVDRVGIPKTPTVKQLQKAVDALNKFIRESKLNEL